MNSFAKSLGFAILPLCLAVLYAQTPDARGLLARADAALLTAKTYRISGIVVTTTTEPASSTSETFLDARSEARVHSETGSGQNLHVYVYDGSTGSDYFASDNTYHQVAAQFAIDPPVMQMLRSGHNASNLSSAAIEREEEIEFAGATTPCYVVRAEYSRLPARPGARGVVRTVWIARSSALIVRDSWEMASNLDSKARFGTQYDFDRVEWDTLLPEDLFVFRPPAGSKARSMFTPTAGMRITGGMIVTARAVTLTSSLNPSHNGNTVTFTATVLSSNTGTPAGSVTFKEGTSLLGTGGLNGGKAMITTSALDVGTHSITAVYGGDPKFNGSTSSAINQKVLP